MSRTETQIIYSECEEVVHLELHNIDQNLADVEEHVAIVEEDVADMSKFDYFHTNYSCHFKILIFAVAFGSMI
ncbi:hypothetical protein Tco_1147417 [Tanacetum coccineum]